MDLIKEFLKLILLIIMVCLGGVIIGILTFITGIILGVDYKKMWFKFKLWVMSTWLSLCEWVDNEWEKANKELGLITGKGGPLPSLTDTQFLRIEGYKLAIQDLYDWLAKGRSQTEQLVGIQILEHLSRQVGKVK
jgi:hypothetical protein